MLIDIKGANISIDDRKVLENIDFQVNNGEFIYVIGRVGSGKSSLLRALYGECEVEEGEAKVLNFDLLQLRNKHLPELRRRLGIVFQDFALLQHRTVAQNLDFVLSATGWKVKAERETRIREVLEQVDLSAKIFTTSCQVENNNVLPLHVPYSTNLHLFWPMSQLAISIWRPVKNF